MKNPLAAIVLLSSVVLFFVVWPMKARYSSIVLMAVFGVLNALVAPAFHAVLKKKKNLIIFYEDLYTEKTTWPLASLAYLGLFNGIYLSYNFSVSKYVSETILQAEIKYIYYISTLFSCFVYLLLTVTENCNTIRKKYPIIYTKEWKKQEFFWSVWVNITISEYVGTAVAFYSIISVLIYNMFQNSLTLTTKILFFTILFLLCSVLGITCLIRAYKKKLKH